MTELLTRVPDIQPIGRPELTPSNFFNIVERQRCAPRP